MFSPRPLITVITPTYNAEKYIQQCIESVQGQTFRNFEHLILDGQSQDSTLRLIQESMQKYPGIRIESAKDRGIYDAMNKGIRLADGEWIYFLGADDSFHDLQVLEQIAGALSKKEAQIIYGNVFFRQLQRIYDFEFDLEKILKHNICHQAIFYQASVFREMGEYKLIYKTEADYDFNLRCWLSGRISHRYIPLVIADYAEGGASSAQRDERFVQDFPSLTVDTVLQGNWTHIKKIDILSRIYRKIIQRKEYRIGILFRQLFRKSGLMIRLPAIMWMFVSSLRYLIKKTGKPD